jgi:hypothetical protein
LPLQQLIIPVCDTTTCFVVGLIRYCIDISHPIV